MADRIFAGAPLHWHGTIPFAEAAARNDALVRDCKRSGQPALMAFEPQSPVLTLGRRAGKPAGRAELATTIARCKERAIAVIDADRGGLATLHLPGQLVVFVAIPAPFPPVGALVCELLRGARAIAEDHGVSAQIVDGADAGLWRGADKLASVGMRIRDRAIFHGMSVNVAIDSALADGLVLCGHSDRQFASIAPQSNDPTPSEAVVASLSVLARALATRAAACTGAHAHASAAQKPAVTSQISLRTMVPFATVCNDGFECLPPKGRAANG